MREFSADSAFYSVDAEAHGETGFSYCNKYYVRGNIMRIDELVNGIEIITIHRPDKEVIWHVYPQSMSYEERTLLPGVVDYDSESTRISLLITTPDMKSIGREMCNGFECDKYEQRTDWEGKSSSITIWVSRELEHVVKTETKTPTSTTVDEICNIQDGKLPDSVFELPDGYTKRVENPVEKPEQAKSQSERTNLRKPLDPNLSPQYSADVFENGKQIGRIFVKGCLLSRNEYALRSEEFDRYLAPIMIRRSDYSMAIFPNPKAHVYNEWSSGDTHWGIGPQPIGIKSMPYAITGCEDVSGYECAVYHVEYDSQGKHHFITLWISKYLDNVVRCEYNEPARVRELRNIEEGVLPDDLFDAPIDYEFTRDW